MILYLHGFRSSPLSFKAQLAGRSGCSALGRGDEYLCPQLPASPQAAMALALELVQSLSGGRADASSALRWAAITRPGWPSGWVAARCCSIRRCKPPRDLEPHVGVSTALSFRCSRSNSSANTSMNWRRWQWHASPARTLFPDRGHRRRSAGLARNGRALSRRAAARDQRQRPWHCRISPTTRMKCWLFAAWLRRRTATVSAMRRRSAGAMVSRMSMASIRRPPMRALADRRVLADGQIDCALRARSACSVWRSGRALCLADECADDRPAGRAQGVGARSACCDAMAGRWCMRIPWCRFEATAIRVAVVSAAWASVRSAPRCSAIRASGAAQSNMPACMPTSAGAACRSSAG